jgi:hypothetical protein
VAASDNGAMASISTELLVNAARQVERLSLSERTQLADELHALQPNLFFSVLALQGFDAAIEDMEMVLMLLIVFHEAMKASGRNWPVISEDVQDRGLKRITARMRPGKRLTGQRQMRATAQSIANHPEQPMLAYVFGKFSEHGLLGIETEAHKMVMLAALNLVECIALTAPVTTKRGR